MVKQGENTLLFLELVDRVKFPRIFPGSEVPSSSVRSCNYWNFERSEENNISQHQSLTGWCFSVGRDHTQPVENQSLLRVKGITWVIMTLLGPVSHSGPPLKSLNFSKLYNVIHSETFILCITVSIKWSSPPWFFKPISSVKSYFSCQSLNGNLFANSVQTTQNSIS